MADNLNLGQFSRLSFVNQDGTLTREAQRAMAIVQRRAGDLAGLVYADTITNVPAGGIAAVDVQTALNELDAEKVPTSRTVNGKPLSANVTLNPSDIGAQPADTDLDVWAAKTAPAGAVVGTTDTQTLSSKTLASPIVTGSLYSEQINQTTKVGAAVLTVAELITKIIEYTGAAATLTLPTGFAIDAAIPTLANDRAFDFSVINTGSGAAALGTAAGLTLTGSMSVAAGASGLFRVRRTAANTYTVYRIA